ncbi:MAG: hypothetical protein ACOY4O_16750 [Pseudomonadota bacterium]
MEIRLPKRILLSGAFVVLFGLSVGEVHAVSCKRGDKQPQIPLSVGVCGFDAGARSFSGSAAQQAACLTRRVQFANSAIGPETLSTFLENLVDTTAPSGGSVQAYLRSLGVDATQVGRPIGPAVQAKYFVIHDTSSPDCSELDKERSAACPERGVFPAIINDESWSENRRFLGHTPSNAPAHVTTNRSGQSVHLVDYAVHKQAMKFEGCNIAATKNVFIHVENIQPRISRPPQPTKRIEPFVAPDPAFGPRQYDRLALVYMVASARRGRWLIPAYHGVIDHLYKNGHDDPQNFDMAAFSEAVRRHSIAVGHR